MSLMGSAVGRISRWGMLPVLALLLSGCGSHETQVAGPFLIDLDAAVDGRSSSPDVWRALMERAITPGQQLALARGLGRMRNSQVAPALAVLPDQEPLLGRLSAARNTELLQAWLFALGQSGTAEAAGLLQPFLKDEDPFIRRWAAEALGRLPEGEGDLTALAVLVDDPEPEVRGAAMLALVRWRGRRTADAAPLTSDLAARVMAAAGAGLESTSTSLRWQAAYALANLDLPGRGLHLQAALADDEPVVRLFAVRGLGRLGPADDIPAGTALQAMPALDPDPHVAAAAAETLAAREDGAAIPHLLTALQIKDQPSDHHRRQAAAAALATLLESHPDQAAGMESALLSALTDPSPRVRLQAARGLTLARPAALQDAVVALAADPDPQARQTAAVAMALSEDPRSASLLTDLAGDPVPGVSAAALASLAGREADLAIARRVHLTALFRDDVAVRGAALAGLAGCGESADLDAVVEIFTDASGPDGVELRIEALNTAVALAGGQSQGLLRGALGDPSQAVRQRAVALLADSGLAASPSTSPPLSRPSSVSLPPAPAAHATEPRVRLHTDRGSITIALRSRVAPRHTAAFLALAGEGAYDHLTFHRIVSGFVAQGLDPRGDGWGTCGAFLRDEIHPEPYLRGSVGMPNAGPDTGGCQIFITHVPTPHLDGAYTIFGRVVDGMDVVDALDRGDVVQRVEILPQSP
jgi:cyclophilin family peptidyl-prolyl cis-trans isomerase/HEAT repeat protein